MPSSRSAIAVLTVWCVWSAPGRAAVQLGVEPSINPELAEHTNLFEKRVYKIADNVYSAVGYGLANIIMVVGTDGIVIVDTGVGVDQARTVLGEFRKITDKPVKGIIYTHHHADHVSGASAFVSEEDARSGRIPIIAHQSLMREYTDENGLIAEIMALRAGSQYNSFLSILRPGDTKGMNSGIGPIFRFERSGFIPPTKTFDDTLDITLAGVDMQLMYVPSEAMSEICIFLPQNKVLLSAEVIQDHTFPNIYTLRGASFRNPRVWFQSIDRMRALPAEDMVPAHGPPVIGRSQVMQVLLMYRDALQYVHDQTLRYANKGYAKDELGQVIKLPPHLANFSPWLREFYGSVKHSAPEVYSGYLGWFDGDPVTLDPTPRVELATRLVALMGGRDRVLGEAEKAFAAGDSQYAAELTTYLIRINRDDQRARDVKAAAFRRLGYAQINSNWRGLYLTAANVLENKLSFGLIVWAEHRQYAGMEGPEKLPMMNQLALLSIRLAAEKAMDTTLTMELHSTDRNERYTTILRRGVLEYHEGAATQPDVAVEGAHVDLGRLVSGLFSVDDGLGRLKVVHGTPDDVKHFMGFFEPRFDHVPDFFLR